MKKTLLALIFCTLGGLAYGQSSITLNTSKAGAWLKFSNTVVSAWAGQPGSTAVSWGLYYGTSAGTLDKIYFDAANGFSTSSSSKLWGTITKGTTILNTDPGDYWFQLRAWSAGFNTWEDCKASNDPTKVLSVLGMCPIVQAKTVTTAGSPPPVPFTILWGGATEPNAIIVDLVPVPEPSIIALAGLGLVSLIFIRRRK